MRYNMVDLNVKYYLERFQALKPRSKEWKALRTLFFDKWHRLLSNNEFNYQMEHINRLSEESTGYRYRSPKTFRYAAIPAWYGY